MKKTSFLFLIFCTTFVFGQSAVKSRLTKISHTYEKTKEIENSGKMDASLFPFYHGVASGDPTTTNVILWTRVTPKNDAVIPVAWKVALDPKMQQVVQNGTFITNDSRDYTVKVDVTGLQPGKTYYYTFTALGVTSPTGRTRTVPTQNIEQLRFAVVSCSNYQNGYFNVYDRLAERNDIDAVIHLGDYIYEYEQGGFGYSEAIGRGHEPQNEIITLDDYRVRHSFYKLDNALRRVHQQHPFIVVWDDHEFANDAYVSGAENHQPDTEGDWNTRKNNAWKAYFEWMPIRDNAIRPNQIYRKIQYGNLVDLLLLDTRIEGRDQPDQSFLRTVKSKDFSKMSQEQSNEWLLRHFLETTFQMNEENKALTTAEFDALYTKLLGYLNKYQWDAKRLENPISDTELQALRTEIFDKLQRVTIQDKKASKTLLGEAQFQWFTQQLSTSKAKWKVVGNQVLMMPVLPLQLKDTWNGYTEERERLYNYIKSNNVKNIVVITGDIHMTFVADLPETLLKYSSLIKTGSMGVEFVAPSVTSSNLDEFVGFSSSFLNWLVDTFNPHIKKADLSNHGYFILDVTSAKVQADWNYVATIDRPSTDQFFSHGYYVADGTKFLKKANNPSVFTGTASAQAPLQKGSNTATSSLVVLGNYPNPSVGETHLHFGVSNAAAMHIELFNEQGKSVGVLVHDNVEEGVYNLDYDLSFLPNGIYFLHIDNGVEKVTKKIIVSNTGK
ncbi:alkaline phosphatase D family protein [Flavobacterium sp. GCM10023249]|uniref:alkaline phosphatase D family protein n=1 Tax=unclassified Flavobacterium TaxID=196869 RepID=UPI00361B6D1D